MRALLLAFLCCSLLVQSVGGLRTLYSCPMSDAHALTLSASADAVNPECCNDAGAISGTGEPCKTDMPCCSTSSLSIPSLHVHIPSAKAPTPRPVAVTLMPSLEPSGIWRPPALS
jgi:hypothetical protein